MVDFQHKRGNLLPPYRGTIQDADGPVDLTNASAVLFRMWNRNSKVIIIDDQQVTVDDPSAGTFAYEWQTGDVDTVGMYLAEVDVVFPTGIMTCPNPGHITILISEHGPDDGP